MLLSSCSTCAEPALPRLPPNAPSPLLSPPNSCGAGKPIASECMGTSAYHVTISASTKPRVLLSHALIPPSLLPRRRGEGGGGGARHTGAVVVGDTTKKQWLGFFTCQDTCLWRALTRRPPQHPPGYTNAHGAGHEARPPHRQACAARRSGGLTCVKKRAFTPRSLPTPVCSPHHQWGWAVVQRVTGMRTDPLVRVNV